MTDEVETLDYPVAAPDDIHPRIFRAMLIQHMGLRYLKSVPSIDLEYAMEAAVATGGIERESAYHFQFGEHRVEGEWFERHPDILAEIERLKS